MILGAVLAGLGGVSAAQAQPENAPVVPGDALVVRNCAAIGVEVMFGPRHDDLPDLIVIPGGAVRTYRRCVDECVAAIDTPGKDRFILPLVSGNRYVIQPNRASGRWEMEKVTATRGACGG